MIQGVGPATATLIVSKFGLDTLEVLEHEPERLLEVRGITQKKLDKIRQSFADSQSIRELMTFLSPYGISVNKAKKIQEAFGVNAVETIKNRPFERHRTREKNVSCSEHMFKKMIEAQEKMMAEKKNS